jgi:hypothetical protein
VGPSLATALWHGLSAAAPILLGGVLKTGYDLALYRAYRDLDVGPTGTTRPWPAGAIQSPAAPSRDDRSQATAARGGDHGRSRAEP